jgi:hypothetical protein
MVHRSSDRFFVLYLHMRNYHLLTPEPPSTQQPVKRVLHCEHVASEHFPPEHQIIALIEYLRPTPVLHAHTAHLRFPTRFLFHAYTIFWDLFANILLHPCTPNPRRPTHLAVYQRRTLFFLTGSELYDVKMTQRVQRTKRQNQQLLRCLLDLQHHRSTTNETSKADREQKNIGQQTLE